MGSESAAGMWKIKGDWLRKKHTIFFCIIVICFLCILVTCVIFLDSPEKYKKFIFDIEESIVRDYAQVEAVNILEFDGWGRAGMLRMRIFFHDNNWLLLGNVHCNKTLDLKKNRKYRHRRL
jgi:hypothetical protein